MLPILLAGLTAVVWGTGDFCGGKATQRSSALAVTVLSQVAALPVLVVCVALAGDPLPGAGAFARAVFAGVFGFIGILLLYQGLSRGAMAIFAPVTAVTAAVVPLLAGLLLERRPAPLALVGAGCAVVAIGLVSLTGADTGREAVTPALIGLALAAGVAFGIFFVLLGRTGPDSGMWPLAGVRVGSIGLGLLALARTRTPLRVARPAVPWMLAAGSFDTLANGTYLLATAGGLLSVIAPIASLYPASTVVLACLVDRERIRPVQLAGLGMAATALVLTAA
ncbi:MAG: DMT family transporter [Micromonosporaceae bacterium]|nr:DMT family transporter [Micromonosporaceae bacterium]